MKWLILLTALASAIILNPIDTPCYFVWKINYSDSTNLTVGDDFIEHGGIRIYVHSNDPIEFDIVKWNPKAITTDGDIVVELIAVYDKPSSFSMTVFGLIPDREYTVLKNGSVITVERANESGAISFTGTVGSAHSYAIVTGNQTHVPEVIYIAPPIEKTIVYEIIDYFKSYWVCILILLMLLLILVLICLRRR